MSWEPCDGCDGGVYEDDDDDGMYEPTVRTCPACNGMGGWWHCLSDYDGDANGSTWCEGNPRVGRMKVPCSAVEEFVCYADGSVTYNRGAWAVLIEVANG